MEYRLFLYSFFIVLSALVFSSINFDNFFKKNKVFEARLFFIILSLISGYLLTNLIIDFMNLSL